MRVLMALCAVLDFENFIQLSQADLAKLIGMKQPHVNRAMAELFERGIVIKGMKVGRSLTYRLSPTFGFKTKGSNFTKLMADINTFARAGNGTVAEK
jgi:DNA-binding transcriptional ArsR family regulator